MNHLPYRSVPIAWIALFSGLLPAVAVDNKGINGKRPVSLPGAPSSPIPPQLFGMTVLTPGIWPNAPFGVFGKAGGTLWPYLEPSKGVFNWYWLDQAVSETRAHGTKPYWTNFGVPPWAASNQNSCYQPPNTNVVSCSSMVANIQDWKDFLTALVSRYKGQIEMYELWNEPDLTFSGTMQQLVQLNQSYIQIVRAIDPSALIATPSATTATFLTSYFAAGGPTSVDVLSIHGYPGAGNDYPEAIQDYKLMPWMSVTSNYNLTNLPIWDTESSWGPNPSSLSTPERVGFVARAYLLHWSAGVSRFYWYAWDSQGWGTLWSRGTRNAAGDAYAQVYGWMNGATMPKSCTYNGSDIYHATYACTLTRPGGYSALAVWNTQSTCNASSCSTSSYRPNQMYVQYRDLAGNLTPIQPGQIVQISSQPILFENRSPR
jgi:hypothetical protein